MNSDRENSNFHQGKKYAEIASDITVSDLRFQLADGINFNGATIYGNGLNMVAVLVTFECIDKNGEIVKLDAADILSSTYLCTYNDSPVSKIPYTADNSGTGWCYTDTPSLYLNVLNYQNYPSTSPDDTPKTGEESVGNYNQIIFYVYSSNKINTITLAAGVSINGIDYTTRDTGDNLFTKSITLTAVDKKTYFYKDMLLSFGAVTSPSTDVDHQGAKIESTTSNQKNYYLSIGSDDGSHPYVRSYRNDNSGNTATTAYAVCNGTKANVLFFWPIWQLTTPCVYTQKAPSDTPWQECSVTEVNPNAPIQFATYDMAIGQRRGALCMSRLAYDHQDISSNGTFISNNFFHIFDQYGNSGYFKITPSSDGDTPSVGDV